MDPIKFLEQATNSNNQTTKKIYRLGGVLLVIVIIYLTWIIHSLRSTVLDPKALAEVITGVAHENTPVYINSVKQALIDNAPVTAENVKNQIMDLFHVVRGQGEEVIDQGLTLIPAMQIELEEALQSHFNEHRNDMIAFAKAHENTDLANKIIKDLLNTVGKEIEARLTFNSPKEGAKAFGVSSLESLRKINGQLVELANKNKYQLTQEERIKRRLIVTWTHFLEDHFKDQKLQLTYIMP